MERILDNVTKNVAIEERNQQKKITNDFVIATYSNQRWYVPTNTGRKFLPRVYADYFVKKHNLVTTQTQAYLYSNGYYKIVDDEYLRTLIIKDFDFDYKVSWRNEALEIIKDITFIDESTFVKSFNCNSNIINLRNGLIVFDFESGNYKFQNHSKKNKSTIRINASYSKEYEDFSKALYFNKFINTSLNNSEERLFLQEITGYFLINHLADGQGQSIFAFHGEGGNGKGTYDRLLIDILGIENVFKTKASVVSDAEKQNQFFGFQTVNKLALIISETNYGFKDLTLLKELSGGDLQNYEVKGSMQSRSFVFRGKCKISTNKKIKIYDTSKGVRRRLKFLKMDNEIKEVIHGLDEKLRMEKNYIFIWALEGLKRLIMNNWRFTLPDSHFDLLDKYISHSNNYVSFIRNHIEKNGVGIAKTEMFNLMNDEYGNIYKNKNDLYENIERALFEEGYNFTIKKGRYITSSGEKTTYGYSGISYVEQKSDKKKDITVFRIPDMKEFKLSEHSILPDGKYFQIINSTPVIINDISKKINDLYMKDERKSIEEENRQQRIY